ncbi:General stress protein 69 [Caulifigura coniformis]|uniref:General stress protein 69 n=1 Tax=Caulifigura coniformis TaxID=2527983 RepID=A0A517SDN0_9PLAN|nr:aldo/keto reductase [Caulifigura coniformis]QDT54230.1 General stress protein 69 [Caulifigura coniformis]
MQLRSLGTTGFNIAPLALGGNVFGWTADEPTSFAILDRFVEAGFNLVDTADVYSKWAPGHQGGESEIVLGKWFRQGGKREKIVLATKVGMELGPDRKGLSKRWITRSVEDSLRRLQTDVIDLYQSHLDDESTPLEETLAAYDGLIKAGKVRAIGASNYSAARLTTALEVSRKHNLPAYGCLQPLYNLYDRAVFEAELRDACLTNGVGVIPYFSLGAGFLTGKYRSEADLQGRARGKKVAEYLNERGLRILKALDAEAARMNAEPAQVALAWLIHRPGVTAPIVSATSTGQLDAVLKSASLKLDAEAIGNLDRASDESGSTGRRD